VHPRTAIAWSPGVAAAEATLSAYRKAQRLAQVQAWPPKRAYRSEYGAWKCAGRKLTLVVLDDADRLPTYAGATLFEKLIYFKDKVDVPP